MAAIAPIFATRSHAWAGMGESKETISKPLPWNAQLSFYWDCKQCYKVPQPEGRPPRGHKWDPLTGRWEKEPSSTRASDALPLLRPPPEKKQFISERGYDKTGYLQAKKDWFEERCDTKL